ncbi:MAG: CarD family transcriptional regulator [Hyphomonadaceae bacterium]
MHPGFDPGANVLHPAHGVCRVVGVESVAAAGVSIDTLALEPRWGTGLIRIPIAKLADAGLRALTPEEAENALPPGAPRPRSNSFLFSRAPRASGRSKSARFA